MTCTPVIHTSHFYSFLAQSIAFFLLISLITYWLYTKGIPWLRRIIQKFHDQIEELEKEKELLAEQQRQLDQSIKEQVILFEYLTKNSVQWQLAQEKRRNVIAERHQQILQQLLANTKKREATIRTMYLARLVVPQACEQAHILLQERFLSVERGNQFLSAVCHRIEQQS